MTRSLAGLLMLALVAASCGGDSGNTLPTVNNGDLAAESCLVGDPNCADGADGGAAEPLPSAIALVNPDNPEGPTSISYGGFFYSDGTTSLLCSELAESLPPQCGTVVTEISAPLEIVLDAVAESFGNPDDAKISIDQGIYWTDEWVNISGFLEGNTFVVAG